eukprot:jgi/Mesvir1/17912/Mv12976-RA.2
MSVLANFFKLVLAIAAAYGVIHLGRPLYWGIQGRLSAYNDVPSGRYLQEAAIHGMGMDIPEASRKNLRSLSLLRHPIEVGAGDQGLVSLHAPRDPAEQEALLRRVGLHSTRTDAADVPDEPAPEKVDSRVAAQVADDKQGSNHEKPTAVVEPAPVEVKKEEVLPSPPPPSPPPPAPVVAPPPPTPVHEHVPDVPGTKASEVSHRKLKYMVPQVDPARVMPAKSTFALTKEFVRNHSTEDGIIIVTWANFHYLDFVLNWVTHLMMNGNTNFVVGAMDDQLLRELYIRNIPTFSMDSGLTTSDFGWGSATFHKMGRQKIDLIGLFTNMGFHTLISDVDTVWLRDPLPYMRQYPDVDVLTSSDNLHNTVDDYSLEKYPAGLGPALNIGIMFFRSTDISRKLAKEWSDILQRDDKVWDQNAFNDLIKRGHSRIEGRHDGVFRGYDHKALAGVLPVSTFCSGHTAFVQKMPWKYGLEPYVIHATFQFSGTEGKRHRFREFEYWIDEPAYYDPPGKNFLVYRPNIPNALLHPPEYTVQSHFDLVNFQILQIRTALMMALALDRILVMPKLWCTNDRWWAPHSGLIPGSRTERPFSCPLDHVFDVSGAPANSTTATRVTCVGALWLSTGPWWAIPSMGMAAFGGGPSAVDGCQQRMARSMPLCAAQVDICTEYIAARGCFCVHVVAWYQQQPRRRTKY